MQNEEIQHGLASADEEERPGRARSPTRFFSGPDRPRRGCQRTHPVFCAVGFGAALPGQLRAHAAQLVPLLMERLLDDHPPVADRAIWALNITGETALPHLLAATETPEARLRSMAVWALARNHQTHAATAVALPALLRRLDDEDEGVRFAAFSGVMELTPLHSSPAGPLTGIDMEPIYARLLPVAQHFSRHPNAHFREWGGRMLALLPRR